MSWAKFDVLNKCIDLRSHLPLLIFTFFNYFDVVHGHNYTYLRFIRAGCRIVHFHGDPFYKKNSVDLKPDDFAVLATTDAQIAISDFVKSELAKGLGEKAKLYRVYNAVDHEVFSPERMSGSRDETRKKYGIDQNAICLMYIGAIVEEKGVLELATVYRNIILKEPNLFLIFAGSGTLWREIDVDFQGLSEYEKKVRDILVPFIATGKVKFLGQFSHSYLPVLLAASDVVVIPSLWREGFSLACLESMAMGRAVIASRTGGLPEVVGDSGVLVEPGDLAQLAESILLLSTNHNLRTQLGCSAHHRSLEFNWKKSAEEILRIYHQIMAGK
jgi:glycosyltransferase involved in cell wall biosynthesis